MAVAATVAVSAALPVARAEVVAMVAGTAAAATAVVAIEAVIGEVHQFAGLTWTGRRRVKIIGFYSVFE